MVTEMITVPFTHNGGNYRAEFDNNSDYLSIHHVTTRCSVPFERRLWPSDTPGKDVPGLINKAVEAFVDQVLDAEG